MSDLPKMVRLPDGTPIRAAALLLAAIIPLGLLPACVSPAVQDTLDAVLNKGPASTMVAYVASLSPEVSGMIADADAAVAANAPRVLAVACGVGSAANFVFSTVRIVSPKTIDAATAAQEAAAFTALQTVCPPNPPPASLADAARAALAAYRRIAATMPAMN